ncbi:MAG: Phosphate transport system regulatory protein PhoU [Candidatus Bipolaricaulis sibiricus]|uniref:Phosphate-specific transport system accessory protein PhoU n=1 Tax=Bipolaricaulis sibiricus TaxID=2501609 RepID=A0A410FUI4_BIPS1|nr:MAG: Phosphate transport system regulatory protein PhoU [Candidatus Bipolaricaulis sibiricus]
MVREAFERELRALEGEVVGLGEAVAEAVRGAIYALRTRDADLAERVDRADDDLNRRRFDLEERCLALLATQQPMASDLRVLMAIVHIATDLERMGDHAAGVARLVIRMGNEPLIKPLVDIPRMADLVVSMLDEALGAFVRRDAAAARRAAARDDEVDALHDQVHRELFLLMIQNPSTITQATYLMWASHGLERIADLVTNVCERVVFVAQGVLEDLNQPHG